MLLAPGLVNQQHNCSLAEGSAHRSIGGVVFVRLRWISAAFAARQEEEELAKCKFVDQSKWREGVLRAFLIQGQLSVEHVCIGYPRSLKLGRVCTHARRTRFVSDRRQPKLKLRSMLEGG